MIEHLPPRHLPASAPFAPAPVTLRPLELADNAAAFVLSEIAFGDPAALAAALAERQARWASSRRAWFGWLHERAAGNAWAATVAATGQIVGYARAVRDPALRVEQLTEIFVHPTFQHGQVGRALLAAVLAPAVAPGWRRIICAHPDPAALVLYHRWGTYPLATAWYLTPSFTPPSREQLAASLAANQAEGLHLRPIDWAQDAAAIAQMDRAATGMDRSDQLRFMAEMPGAALLVSERADTITGYGVRQGDSVGPVVGMTPADTLALAQAHLLAMYDAGQPSAGLWVPGVNVVLLHWLRTCGARCLLRGQVQIMASDGPSLAHLDRLTLTAPAYVW